MSKNKRLSQIDPFVSDALALDIWCQMNDYQKDALLLMFQMNPDKTHIHILEMFNFCKAWKDNNRHVRRYVFSCALDRIGAGLDKPRKPGFMS
jgi:hypothetical protein